MPSSNPLFSALRNEGWFVEVVGTQEHCVAVQCRIFSRDYDEETGYTDIVFGDTVCAPGSLRCVAKFHGLFELQDSGPAMLVEQTVPTGFKEMPGDMAAAIAALITPENFPEAADFMCLMDNTYPEDEDARAAFWASINQQISSMTAAGDPWGALKIQTEAVNKLIGWVDPPVEKEEDVIPEPNLEDMVPPSYSLIEAADQEEEDNYLPVGAHLLPEDFQTFLRNWNKTIAAETGDWLGEPRKTYKKANQEFWARYTAQLKEFSALYPTELAALKAYQASEKGKEEAGV